MIDASRREFNAALAAWSALLLAPKIGFTKEFIDDVSRLNATEIEALIHVFSEDAVRKALGRAFDARQKIALAGAKHSQGGHIAASHGTTLDMRGLNRVFSVDEVHKTVTVQAGATWNDVQRAVNPFGLAVAVQQASNIFTVAGSIAVNCHGRDPRHGSLVETVREITLMLADGSTVVASRVRNPDLFAATIGGYGLTGVILQAEIALEDDHWLKKRVTALALDEYVPWLETEVLLKPVSGPGVELHYARPSIRDADLFERIIVVDYLEEAEPSAPHSSLQEEKFIGVNKAMMSLSRSGSTGKSVRWFLQESVVDRPGSDRRISRNNAMRPEVRFLDYNARRDTDILQEYFVPLQGFPTFMRSLKKIIRRRNVNLLSATLRTISRDGTTILGYARGDVVAIVLYINVPRSESGEKISKSWTRELVDLTLGANGTYYLPYQRWPARVQFETCYPRAAEFLAVKKHWDPDGRFGNRWSAEYLGI